jgi:hypothetical protein
LGSASSCEAVSPAIKSLLVLIGLATAIVALLGLLRGSVYCKGGPNSRATQPLAFWASLGVCLMGSALMGYAAFYMHD